MAFIPISQMIKHRKPSKLAKVTQLEMEWLRWNFSLGGLEAESMPLADARLFPMRRKRRN